MRHLSIAAILVLILMQSPPPAVALSQVALGQSDFVFQGHVAATGATNVMQYQVPDETLATVIVDKVISPTALGKEVGQEVTIKLLEKNSLIANHEYLFATKITSFDNNGLALLELDHDDATPELQRVVMDGVFRTLDSSSPLGSGATRSIATFQIVRAYSGQVPTSTLAGKVVKVEVDGAPLVLGKSVSIEAHGPLDLRLIHASLTSPSRDLAVYTALQGAQKEQQQQTVDDAVARSADVAAVSVLSVDQGAAQMTAEPVSWQSPVLHTATVRVMIVFKGALKVNQQIPVLFIESADIHWIGAPQLTSGEQVILLLRPAAEVGIRLPDGTTTLGVYQREDVLDLSSTGLVQKAVKNGN